ncbi:tyrosine-type recombinase/integrase [Pseudomonas sp. NY15372]|uniref:tyrosine-type recombinase/integrase n=1 Tax=Pseudomonas sp. NY15372 TaxID=3400356 RepID=UPI003A85E783
MTTAKHLLSTLKAFHLDRPEATWEELREHLRFIAEEALGNPQGDAYGLVLDDVAQNLREIAHSVPLGLPQAQALTMAQRVVAAAEERHAGNLKPLVDLLESGKLGRIQNSFNEIGSTDSSAHKPLSVPICMSLSDSNVDAQSTKGQTFSALYAAFKAERGGDKTPNTIKNWESCTRVITRHLGDAGMATHTRATFTGLRDALLADNRKPSSVNKIMTHASMVIGWAVDTGLIDKNFSKNLMISKGAESERTAFTQAQLATLQGWAETSLLDDWKASAIALAVATGARIGEIHQLTGADIREEGGQWIMDINDNDGKTLKNSFSRRVVPLVGIPDVHLRMLAATEGRLFGQSMSGFAQLLNQMIRDLLGVKTGEGQSFHSLRHSLASDLKAAGVAVGIAQSILGHSSGVIAYDTYGSNAAASMDLMVKALKLVR